jgi:two-component system alkaline phosphatase synthesis response regulator PhoP
MKGTILIADDNPDSIMVLRTILESNGYTVLTAGDGREVLSTMKRQLPDAVLLDVMMPELSGIDVLKHMRSDAVTARVPVILVTAKGQDDDLLDGYQHGADYYITKPCTAKQLLYGLSMVLGKASSDLANEEPEDLA